ncbi:hypothetical protein RN001_005742 [Aquatica leii]|uniref:Carbonic anhydrase n=1 Tax=Aquatica leii TaxID=1421715 RepID=A0AAN7QKI9_9COLE|nr:hypothetical protein RN001_005742 [Aquatica leii]
MVVLLFMLVAIASGLCPDCILHPGDFQSPVNIITEDVVVEHIGRIRWSKGYSRLPESATLTSNGHTVYLEMMSQYPIKITFPLFPVKYEFTQLHFHWGDKVDVGSEHKIDNKSYPIEMHVVHTQTEDPLYPKYIVLGYFLTLTQKTITGLEEIIPAVIPAASKINTPITVKKFRLSKLLCFRPFSYYTYDGSLTTAPYLESVRWIVGKNPLLINRDQLNVFYKAAQIEPEMLNNHRSPQDLKCRRIIFNSL